MLSPLQQHCLEGIGIRLWRERGAETELAPGVQPDPAAATDVDLPPAAVPGGIDSHAAVTAAPPPFAASAEPAPVAAADSTAAESTAAESTAAESTAAESTAAVPALKLDSWDGIVDAIHACTACELSANCTQKVPGVGDRHARLLIVGEGPGHDEDIRGEPFVGRSGQLLDRMLAAIGIEREQVFITNIVKCRPPNNRDPKPEEALHCRRFLDAQIETIAPRVILSVGRVSAHNLLGCSDPVGKLIRQSHRLPGTEIPLKVTYHPAYLLRNPSAKAIAWQDLKQLHRMLQ